MKWAGRLRANWRLWMVKRAMLALYVLCALPTGLLSALITPPGVYHPEMMARSWFSRRYYNSPMPHAIFFHRGYAIHGTYEISRLGGPASHGCVRLDPDHATILFGLVEREGMRNTTIVVH